MNGISLLHKMGGHAEAHGSKADKSNSRLRHDVKSIIETVKEFSGKSDKSTRRDRKYH
jgi:hypothetical protein